MQSKKSTHGFTLVELALVVVIIGLIAGGITMGQGLLRQSELRATLAQYEAFNGALGAFHTTYGGLPGDIKGATLWGFTGDGNQDGILDHQGATSHDYELVYFWNHLGSTGAGLIKGKYAGQALTTSNIKNQLPKAALGQYWGVFSSRGTVATDEINYFIVGARTPPSGAIYSTEPVLTPQDAWHMDKKADDGQPVRGIIQVINSYTTYTTVPWDAVVTQGASNCVNSNTYQTLLSTKLCVLKFTMAF